MNNTQQNNDGGPAFPSAGLVTPDGIAFDGMSLRDWFAGMALQGRAHRFDNPYTHRTILAKDCYEIADAMLAERNRKDEA